MIVRRISAVIIAFAVGVLAGLVFVDAAHGEIAKEGLVAEYHFEGDAYDSSGNGNTGGVNNAVYIDGKFGKALDFNGVNSSVRIPDSMSLRPVAEITLEAWVKVKGKTTKWSSILSKMEKNQDLGYELYLLPGNKPRFGIISRVGGGKTRVGDATIPGDKWTHIAATYDGYFLILYIDGVLDSIVEKQLFILPSKDDLWIGSWKDIDNFDGAIDEVRIYNRSLSAVEIKANYEAVASNQSQIYTTTPTPTPVSAPEPVVVTTPTGKSVYTRVCVSKFLVLNLQINAGDEVMWDNLDETIYTLVEMDKKIGNITLPDLGRAQYIFNTSGNYRFGLYDKYMKQKAIQDINVLPPNTSISTPSAKPIVTSPIVTPSVFPTLTIAQITTATPAYVSTPAPKSPGFEVILAGTGIIAALILRRK